MARARHPWARYTLTLTATPGNPQLALTLEARYLRDLSVLQEVLTFVTGRLDRATALDRGYRWSDGRAVHAGPLTPHLVTLVVGGASASLVGGRGLQGMRLRRREEGHAIDLELDHAGNHPFWVYRRCIQRFSRTRRPPGQWHGASRRRAGSRREARARWVVGELAPLLVTRYPAGFRSALVLSDHADQSSAARTEAFAFGRTGAIGDGELGEGHPGFVNRGLGYTKSIFLRQAGRYAPQFEDPGYRRVLDQLVPRRVELAVHSPTGRRDRPAGARPLLEAFRAAYAGRTWIDHQPDTNCEAIANQGWNPSSRWYMLGHLRDLAFVYLWSGLDLPLSPGSLNLLAPELPARRRPALYARNGLDGRGPRFVMFSSTFLFLARERLLALLSEPSLDRLSAERGLLIGHVYLDTGRSNGRFRKRALIEERGAGFYRIRPEMDQLFQRLRQRQDRGALWVTGIEAMAEHLLGAMRVELSYLPGGEVELRLPADASGPLVGLTLLLPDTAARVLVDGGPPAGQRDREAWLDLEPGKPRRLQLVDPQGRPLALVAPANVTVR